MRTFESIQEFYKVRHQWIPDEIRNSLRHFNVFELDSPNIGEGAEPLEYGRREWYNIVLVYGGGVFQCSGSEYRVKNHAIAFTNPFTPFGWLDRDKITKGYYCIFNEQFLQKDKRIIEFPPFKTTTTPFYELSGEEAAIAEKLFLRMFNEVSSNYIYKYDVARLLVEELLHLSMRSHSFGEGNQVHHNAAERITIQFLELLEHQFPIDSVNQTLQLLTASDFANRLSVHVNHLNKSVKEATSKTTTKIIKERIAQEAKTLIQLSDWSYSEIAYSLGFKEPAHFNNFFKKVTGLTPSQYRKR